MSKKSVKRLGRPPSQRDNDLVATSIHEAGHAVAAVVMGIKLVSVDVNRRVFPGDINRNLPDGFLAGQVKVNAPMPDMMEFSINGEAIIMPHVIGDLAGPMAESRYDPAAMSMDNHGHGRLDFQSASDRMRLVLCKGKVTDLGGGRFRIAPADLDGKEEAYKALVLAAFKRTDEFVTAHWNAIEAVAEQLRNRRSLTGAEVAAIVADNPATTD